MGVAAGIAGGGVEFGATQERLDDADIGAAFEQMRCKAMTQHMQCDVLPDPGGVGGLMEEASELPGGHRLAGSWTRLPAWKQPTFLKGCSRNVTRWALPPPLPQKSAGGRYAKDTDRVYLAERLLHDPKIDDVVIAFSLPRLEVDRGWTARSGRWWRTVHVPSWVTEEILMRLGVLSLLALAFRTTVLTSRTERR